MSGVEGCLPTLAFSDGAFEAALCIGVLAYLPEPTESLRESRRVLKPDGMMVVQVSNALCPTARLHSLLHRVYRRVGAAVGGPGYPHLRIPLAAYRLRDLRRILERQGFRVDSWARYDFRPPLLEWVAPSAAQAASRRLQHLERFEAMGWAAEGLIVKARAC